MYLDQRLPGVDRWYSSKPEGAGLRVDTTTLDTVCFLVAHPIVNGIRENLYVGTGFIVGHPIEAPAGNITGHLYVVTAKHVVRRARARYGGLFMRYNVTPNKMREVSLNNDDWVLDPDSDAAVLPLEISGPATIQVIPNQMFLTDDLIAEHDVGIGDELVLCGLFVRAVGNHANAPIVRSGVIAAMPGDPLSDDEGNAYPGYLAEVRSLGGLSGSPVFMIFDYERKSGTKYKQSPKTYVLGLVRGHWDYRSPLTPADALAEEVEKINLGIAIVTPIQSVARLLAREELVKRRLRIEGEVRQQDAATLDSGEGLPGEEHRRGPEPERLAIDLPMDDAVRHALHQGKPPKGRSAKGKRKR